MANRRQSPDEDDRVGKANGHGKLIEIIRSDNAVIAVLVLMLCPEARLGLFGF